MIAEHWLVTTTTKIGAFKEHQEWSAQYIVKYPLRLLDLSGSWKFLNDIVPEGEAKVNKSLNIN